MLDVTIHIYSVDEKEKNNGRYCVRTIDEKGIIREISHKTVSGMLSEYEIAIDNPLRSYNHKNGYRIIYCPDCDNEKIGDLLQDVCGKCGRSRSEMIRHHYYQIGSDRTHSHVPHLKLVK